MDFRKAPYCTEAKVRNGCLSTEQTVIDASPQTCTAIKGLFWDGWQLNL